MRLFRNQPLFVILMIFVALAMYVPMGFAIRVENWLAARAFFYHASVFLLLAALITIALSGRPLNTRSASRLLDLAAAFIVLPLMMALPVSYLIPQMSFLHAYFEMLSSFTTTGASLINIPDAVPESVHLWRGTVSWLGGLLMLVVALAIFMPINLGGFEVYTRSRESTVMANRIKRADVRARTIRYAAIILPVYVGLTAALTILLMAAGERLLVATVHAMSTLSTSGISPIGGVSNSVAGQVGEMMVFIFMITAVSRFFFLQDVEGRGWKALKSDKEINLMIAVVILIPALLFVRHWLAAQEFEDEQNLALALRSLWGGVFTVLSFLTTTGFESQSWEEARNWSGLSTSGLILMGLAVMGGGIATTAGGVKLLRIYALYKHGIREMARLSYPSSVGGAGAKARSIRREGAYAAWIFLMIFLISVAFFMLLLSATGIGFENSLILAIAGLSNTGPLLGVATETGLTYAAISDTAKMMLCAAMVLGRLEALAVIAILNPDFWRK